MEESTTLYQDTVSTPAGELGFRIAAWKISSSITTNAPTTGYTAIIESHPRVPASAISDAAADTPVGRYRVVSYPDIDEQPHEHHLHYPVTDFETVVAYARQVIRDALDTADTPEPISSPGNLADEDVFAASDRYSFVEPDAFDWLPETHPPGDSTPSAPDSV